MVYRLGLKKLEHFEAECDENGGAPAPWPGWPGGGAIQNRIYLLLFQLVKVYAAAAPRRPGPIWISSANMVG
jgi:hypothetical protein